MLRCSYELIIHEDGTGMTTSPLMPANHQGCWYARVRHVRLPGGGVDRRIRGRFTHCELTEETGVLFGTSDPTSGPRESLPRSLGPGPPESRLIRTSTALSAQGSRSRRHLGNRSAGATTSGVQADQRGSGHQIAVRLRAPQPEVCRRSPRPRLFRPNFRPLCP